jgi:uncharacterized Zn-binding protein involved in type VI secretion
MTRMIAIILLVAAAWLTITLFCGCGFGYTEPAGTPAVSSSSKALTTAGVVATAGGAVLTAAGQPHIGIPLLAGGATTLVLGLTLAKFGDLIAIGGLVALAAGVVVVLVLVIRKYKTGFAEVVAGAQTLKTDLVKAGTATKDAVNNTLRSAQSDKTQELVKTAKEKLGLGT